MIVPFKACSTMMISGATGTGKTTFIHRLLESKNTFTKPVSKIIYCYGVYQPLFDRMRKDIPNIEFHEGIFSELDYDGNRNIIIFDDLASQIMNNKTVETYFTQGAHHKCYTVIFITQNLFSQGKCARTITLNTHYLILFKNLRDGQQILNLGKQIYPGKGQILVEAYTDATSHAYNYLVVDMSPHSEDRYRLRSNIFEDTWIYVPKSIKDA